MKKITLITTISLLSLSTCFAYFLSKKGFGETDVSFKESKTRYTLTARFDTNLTSEVKHFLDSCIIAERIRFQLKDRAVFQHELTSGNLELKAERKANTPSALARIKKICQDIRYVIVPR